MWAGCVEVTAPALDHNLRLPQAVEDLAVEQFVPKAGVEAFDKAVLPRAAGRDVGRLGTDCADPFLHGFGYELRTIVGPNVSRHPAQYEQIGQHIDHVDGFELSRHPDRQALVRELVEDVEHAILPPVVSAILHEVVGPHVIAMLGPQADTRAVRQP